MIDKKNYNRIKAVLADKNVSSKEFPKLLERTESNVSRRCINDVQLSVEVFYQPSKFLDVNIRELLVSTE